jgi:D-aminopeptidase
MEIFIMDSGMRTKNRDLEFLLMQWVTYIRGNSKMERKMEGENKNSRMVIFIEENSKMGS